MATKRARPKARRERMPASAPTAAPPQRAQQRRAPGTPVEAPLGKVPVVGIGASAGGIQALTELLSHLTANTGMAFVVVQHMDPHRGSSLPEVLSRATKMRVTQVSDGAHIQPNVVYVAPPNYFVGIESDKLRLQPFPQARPYMPIDHFFRSLAHDYDARSFGVVLSGVATDGTLGLGAIKAEGGITFAQDEATAAHFSMPHSAITAGIVDFVLAPEAIARELAKIGPHPYLVSEDAVLPGPPKPEETAAEIFSLVRKNFGVDFTHYKLATLQRRILRRMVLHKLKDARDYVTLLRERPQEIEALFHDFLINVTRFFRDSSVFEAIRDIVVPDVIKKRAGTHLRVWVPGCATGEEAYSLAITLLEGLASNPRNVVLQIFATDLSESVIEKARSGVYLDNIVSDVPPDLLRKYFVKVAGGYHVCKVVRETCTFARHDLAKDPPFSRMDLISCRNVLIYLGPSLQARILPTLHYALNPGGYLVLGSSETVGQFSELFQVVDRKNKIYNKRVSAAELHLEMLPAQRQADTARTVKKTAADSALALQQEADRIILNRYAPAAVLINSDLEVLQFRGRTSHFLEAQPGRATLNVLKMAREGLLLGLQTAIHRAKRSNVTVRKTGLRTRINGHTIGVNVEVLPIGNSIQNASLAERHFLITFEEISEAAPPPLRRAGRHLKGKRESLASEVQRVNLELAGTRDYLQSAIEQQEATNEELTAANEELQSSNEELQSTNEELETAKEEVQSTNEELATINQELINRNAELDQAYSDLSNLLSSANIPIVMLGEDLRIRRFTPGAQKVLNLIPSDLGRPIANINPNIDLKNLDEPVRGVIQSLETVEMEVREPDGHWHLMKIQPYKTSENRIEGVVIAFLDIDARKRAEEALRASVEERYRLLFEASPQPMMVFDLSTRGVLAVNEAAVRQYGWTRQEFQNVALRDLHPPSLTEKLRAHVSEFSRKPLPLKMGAEEGWRHLRKDGTEIEVEVTWNLITFEGRRAALMIAQDVTLQRQAEGALRHLSTRLLQSQDEERRRIARELHDSTSQSLASLALNLAMISEASAKLEPDVRKRLSETLTLAQHCSREINVLSYLLHPPLLDEVGLLPAIRWYVDGFANRSGVQVKLSLPESMPRLSREKEMAVYRIVQESLTNIHRHSGSQMADLALISDGDAVRLEVRDNGRGMKNLDPPEPSAGVGISGMRERLRELDGKLEVETGADGTCIRAVLPAASRTAKR